MFEGLALTAPCVRFEHSHQCLAQSSNAECQFHKITISGHLKAFPDLLEAFNAAECEAPVI
jgi:hypothetical protein